MIFQMFYSRAIRRLASTMTMCAVLAPAALAQTPSQVPLLNRNGGGVPPNVMLTVDDSGSMMFQHMPEDKIKVAGQAAIASPVGTQSIIFDPGDSYGQLSGFFIGTIAGNLSTTRWQQMAMRSPDTNTIFYSPELRYLPWAVATYPLPAATTTNPAGRMANSPPNAAFEDPMNPGSGTINLTATASTFTSGTWCFSNSKYASNCGSAGNTTSTKVSHDPGVYFRLQSQDVSAGSFLVGAKYVIKTIGTTKFNLIGASNNTVGLVFTATGIGTGTGVASVYLAADNFASYKGYSINVLPTAGSYTKYPKRTDCAGTVCTQTEERQNFANWFSYYRTRNLLARGSLSEAFSTSTNTFRVGFGRINKGSGTVDGVSTSVLESDTTNYGGGGVRDFTAARKAQFFKWIQDLPASGGTPLPDALDAVGQYFSRTDAKGPWTDAPGASGNTVANNKTCRRSYNIMMTDGYWNSNSNSLGSDKNSDNTDGLVITHADGIKTYQFKAGTKPYADGTNYTLADYAMHYWKTDLQPATPNAVVPIGDNVSFWQNLTNFTIGLGVTGSLDPTTDLGALTDGSKSWPAATTAGNQYNVDDLWHAAVNSRGAYFSAKDPAELAGALSTALGSAIGGSAATAGVATASTVLEAGNRKYVPTYISGTWSGDVSAKPLDVNGQEKSAVWFASAKWPVKPTAVGGTDWNQRKIFTWDPDAVGGAQAVPLTWATISAPARSAMGSVATTYTSQFVDFLRGDHSNEGTAITAPFRLREDSQGVPFVLGDFVNSTPVFVQGNVDSNYSGLATGGSSYQAFLTFKASRLGVLFVGGNDGMLHAFQDTKVTPATDGQEVFAYVPRAVYPNLSKLADKTYGTVALPHQYFVDGLQNEADAYVRAPGATPGTFAASASWRNYLAGSLGAGGQAVYALDVTDTSNLGASTVRWEISNANDADVGYVMSPIEVGVLPNGKWVALFGNGNSSGSGKAVLFVVDLETGAFNKLTVDASSGNGLGGVAVQKDATGQIVRIYAGDLKGNLWRMDYNSTTASNFKTYQESGVDKALFIARTSGGLVQPISQPSILYDHSLGGTLVVFGTGQLFSATDASDTTLQSMYGIWDKVSGSVPDTAFPRAITRASLAARTVTQFTGANSAVFYSLSGTPVDWTIQRGWVTDLNSISGLRTIYPPQKISFELALISTVAPAQAAAVCQSTDGKGINFLIDVEQGANPAFNAMDTNGDGVVNSLDTVTGGYATTADGIDRVIYSANKASIPGGSGGGGGGPCGAGFFQTSIQNASGQVLTCLRNPTPPAAGGPLTVQDRVQRRIINPPIR